MDATRLAALASLLAALSVASERLVEIVKGLFPCLNKVNADENKEGWRRAALHALSVGAGIGTALLAQPSIPKEYFPAEGTAGLVGLGLLASGGSGFWNSMLTYATKVKDLKKFEAKKAGKT